VSTRNSYDVVVLIRRIETESDRPMFMCLHGFFALVTVDERWNAVGNGVKSCWRCCRGIGVGAGGTGDRSPTFRTGG